MKYYKVKPEYDNAPRFFWDTRVNRYGYVRQNGILIANELYTENERAKLANHKLHFEIVNINKNKTYCFFGARFAE